MIEKVKSLVGNILKPDGSVDIGILILRVLTGVLMLQNHGLSKITSGTARWERLGHALTDMIGIDSFHVFFGFLASLAESLGAILISIGLFTRVSSFLLFFTMMIASLKHFFKGDFSELAIVYAVICVVFIISGSGKYGLDYYFFRRK